MPNTKLTEKEVLEIKQLIADGIKQKPIADRYGISQTHVSMIKNNNTWFGVKIKTDIESQPNFWSINHNPELYNMVVKLYKDGYHGYQIPDIMNEYTKANGYDVGSLFQTQVHQILKKRGVEKMKRKRAPGAGNKGFSLEIKKQISTLYFQKFTRRQIANKLKISYSSVVKHIKNLNLDKS